MANCLGELHFEAEGSGVDVNWLRWSSVSTDLSPLLKTKRRDSWNQKAMCKSDLDGLGRHGHFMKRI